MRTKEELAKYMREYTARRKLTLPYDMCNRCFIRPIDTDQKRCERCNRLGREQKKRAWNDPQRQQAIKDRNSKWRSANPEKKRAGNANWRNVNRGRHRENSRRWTIENRKLYNEIQLRAQHKRRAKLKGAEGSYTQKEWHDLIIRFDNLCAKCAGPHHLEVDHIIPISKGGSNYIYNIQPLCRSCNARKWTHASA